MTRIIIEFAWLVGLSWLAWHNRSVGDQFLYGLDLGLALWNVSRLLEAIVKYFDRSAIKAGL